MKREIYEVVAKIVDSNGNYSPLDGYPKSFDSRNYDNDIDKTCRRAIGEISDCWGKMCKRDDRQLQTVYVIRADGYVVDKKSYGAIADLPDPTPEPEE